MYLLYVSTRYMCGLVPSSQSCPAYIVTSCAMLSRMCATCKEPSQTTRSHVWISDVECKRFMLMRCMASTVYLVVVVVVVVVVVAMFV